MSDLYFIKRLIALKKEGTYGVDAAPTGAEAMLASNVSVSPLEGELIKRENVRPYAGNFETILIGKHVVLQFDIEVQGAGVKGTAPAYASALLACGRDETVTPGTKVDYAMHDLCASSGDSATIYVHWSGQKHAMLGCRGNVKTKFDKGIPYWSFQFTGLYVGPVAAVAPAANTAGFKKPLEVSMANTVVALHGHTCKLVSLELDQGNDVKYQNRSGEEVVTILERAPKGSMTLLAPDLASKDFFAIVAAGTTGALTVTHGTADGYKVTHSLPAVELSNLRMSDIDKRIGYQFDLNPLPVNGNDEWLTTVA